MSTRKESHPTLKLKKKKFKILRFIFYFKKIPFLHTPPSLKYTHMYVRTYVPVKTDFWADTTPYPQLNF